MARNLEVGEFKLTLKAVNPDLDTKSPFTHELDDNVLRIRGIASGTDADLHDDIITESTVKSFKEAIENGITDEDGTWSFIPLRNGHRNNWDDVLGWVTKAEIDDNNNLWIEAELDEDSSRARDLYNKLTKPNKVGKYTQLGFSIGGKILKFSKQWDAVLNKSMRILEAVALREISVVGAPAFPTAYVEAITKSLDDMPETVEESMADNPEVQDTNEEVHEDSVQIEIPDEVPEEDTNPETTARTDPDVNAPDASKDDETMEPNEAEEVVEETTDPNADIRADIAKLTEAVSALNARFVESVENAEEVSKSAEETQETDVEKSAPSFDMDALKTLIEGVVTEAVSKVTDELNVIKSTVDDLANEPVDGSFSVRKAKESSEGSPLDTFKSRISNAEYSKGSVLADAVHFSLNK